MAFSCFLFSKISSIIDVLQGPRRVSDYCKGKDHDFMKYYLYRICDINTFPANVSILYSLKYLWFSGVFRRYKMGRLVRSWSIQHQTP